MLMNNLLKLLAIFLLTSYINAYGCDAYEQTEQLASKLTISDTSLNFSQADGFGTISIMGTIKNQSKFQAEDLVIEVKYFDQQGKKSDVVTQTLYGIVVPPSQEVDFRVRDQADKSKEFYVTSSARIVSAQPKCLPKSKTKKNSLIVELLISWGPMLLLIGVWIFAMKKYSGKNSPQKQSLSILEKQTEIISQQAGAIERIANAVDQGKVIK
jgi:ATP-dependent Zn protease